MAQALSSLKGLDLSSCAVRRLVDLFSFVLRRFWAAPVAASGSRIGPVGRPRQRPQVLDVDAVVRRRLVMAEKKAGESFWTVGGVR
jgi:hypothetical protein